MTARHALASTARDAQTEPLADQQERVRRLPPAARTLDRIVIDIKGRLRLVRPAEVEWIEAAGSYVRLHIGSGAYLLRESMGAIEEKLDPRRFLRIHRSTIVNLDHVTEFVPHASGDYHVIMRDGSTVTLSRRYRHRLAPLLGRL